MISLIESACSSGMMRSALGLRPLSRKSKCELAVPRQLESRELGRRHMRELDRRLPELSDGADDDLLARSLSQHEKSGTRASDVIDSRRGLLLVGPAPDPCGDAIGPESKLKQPAHERDAVQVHVTCRGVRSRRICRHCHPVHLANGVARHCLSDE
jgi:hypothetical protein